MRCSYILPERTVAVCIIKWKDDRTRLERTILWNGSSNQSRKRLNKLVKRSSSVLCQDNKSAFLLKWNPLLSILPCAVLSLLLFVLFCFKLSFFLLLHSLQWRALVVSGCPQSWTLCCWPAPLLTPSAWRPAVLWRKSIRPGTSCSTPSASPSSRTFAGSTSERRVVLGMKGRISSLPKTIIPLLFPHQTFALRNG